MDEHDALAILDAVHLAWCNADFEAMASQLADDLDYQCNAGTADGAPLNLKGRDSFISLWQTVRPQIDSTTIPETCKLLGNVARAQIAAWVQHKRTGHVLEGTFRQIVTFRDNKICAIEEYHDAAKMAAFWAMVAYDEATGARPDPDAQLRDREFGGASE